MVVAAAVIQMLYRLIFRKRAEHAGKAPKPSPQHSLWGCAAGMHILEETPRQIWDIPERLHFSSTCNDKCQCNEKVIWHASDSTHHHPPYERGMIQVSWSSPVGLQQWLKFKQTHQNDGGFLPAVNVDRPLPNSTSKITVALLLFLLL